MESMEGEHLKRTIRVLYSFPRKIRCGSNLHDRLAAGQRNRSGGCGAACLHRRRTQTLNDQIPVRTTLARGRIRIPYRVLGPIQELSRSTTGSSPARFRPWRTASTLSTYGPWWLRTLESAARLGIPTVLERPNAHTRFAYESSPRNASGSGSRCRPITNTPTTPIFSVTREEYALADYLLCPSDFVLQTFLDEGFPREKLLRHTYGFDPSAFFPPVRPRDERPGLTVLFAGVAAVSKGLHLALEAWVRSPASAHGTFLIAGEILPAYRARLSKLLAHPSVNALGHRTDMPDLMRLSDVLVLPSLEEGYGLVCAEAIGCACVPLVSDACTDVCRHMDNALVHTAGDVGALTEHLTVLHEDGRCSSVLGTVR